MRFSTFRFRTCLLLASVTGVLGARSPNIVVFLADDLGWNGVGFQGNADVDTPNLDRLAAQGMRFTRAYAETQCSPARGAFLSGRWPSRTGLTSVTHERPPAGAPLRPAPVREMGPDIATLARVLRDAGYVTGLSGKWHIADNYNAAPLRTRDEGRYFDRYGFNFVGNAANGVPQKDRFTDGITTDLVGFIERNRERPFFAYFAYHAPHTPMEAPQALIEKYVERGFVRSSTNLSIVEEAPTADYYAMIEHLDTAIGRVLAKLDELNLTENTLVLFTSDNGGLNRMASMNPLRGAKGLPYEGGIRVPLVMRWPARVRPGAVCETPVHFVDFHPTFAEAAGGGPSQGVDGRSLIPLLEERGEWPSRALYWHMPTYTVMYGRTPCAVVMEEDWKLIHYFGDFLDLTGSLPEHQKPYGRLVPGARTELYHLGGDRSEAHDLAQRHPERVAGMMASLRAHWMETGAALPEANPDYRPGSPDWWRPAPPRSAKQPLNPTRHDSP
jgi:uncharacterized sulfatase